MGNELDLDLVASFASELNAEFADINRNSSDSNTEIPFLKNAHPPQQGGGQAGGLAMDPNFANDGFGDIDPQMMQMQQNAQAPMPPNMPPQPTQMAQQPVIAPTGAMIFQPDMQSMIYRQLLTLTKNQQKIINILIEDRKDSKTKAKPKTKDK